MSNIKVDGVSVLKKLLDVQKKIAVKKNLKNDFGGYKYRSAETILDALKPLLEEVNAVNLLFDELVLIGDRYYIQATAQFIDTATGERIESRAFAREELTKKGMDASQITGSASSYARKYAMNGLYAIDDTKDADSMDNRDVPEEETKKNTSKKDNAKTDPKVVDPQVTVVEPEKPMANKELVDELLTYLDQDKVDKTIKFYKLNSIYELALDKATKMLEREKNKEVDPK